jgi:hypothetical protein
VSLRAIAAALVVGLGSWALVAIFSEPEAPHAAVEWTSSRQCAECHAAQFDEWKDSWHAQSWTDADVRKLSDDFANSDCIDCHAPRPVLETGAGKRVLPRATRRVEGVDCIACHQAAGGRMAGTIDAPSAPCRSIAQRELIRPEFCSGCHDQHGTVQQWRASRFAEPGDGFKDCLTCHMPYRDGDPSKGRVHTMHGGHDLALLKSAVTLAIAADGGTPLAVVENVGAGHNFPTDERSRASDVFWRPLAEPRGPWRHLHRFRNPYRYEVGQPNTELPAGERVRLPIEDPAAAAGVEVALFYKLSPYYADPANPDPEREATLVHLARWTP